MWECLKPSLYWWAEGFSGPVWCCGLSSDTDSTCFKRQWELFLMPGGCHPPDSLKLYWVDSLFLPSSGLRVSGSRPGSEKTSSCVVLGCTVSHTWAWCQGEAEELALTAWNAGRPPSCSLSCGHPLLSFLTRRSLPAHCLADSPACVLACFHPCPTASLLPPFHLWQGWDLEQSRLMD